MGKTTLEMGTNLFSSSRINMDDIDDREEIPMKERREKEREREEEDEREREKDSEEWGEGGEKETDFGGGSRYPKTHELPEIPASTDMKAITAVDKFVQDTAGVRVNWKSGIAIDIRNRTKISPKGNVLYRRRGSSGTVIFLEPKVVLMKTPGGYKYNEAKTNSLAVEEFRQSINKLVEESRDFRKISSEMPMVTFEFNSGEEGNEGGMETDFSGLTPQENRELRGSLIPGPNILPETRDEALRAQANHFDRLLKETEGQLFDKEQDADTLVKLDERVSELKKARDLVLEQRDLEQVRGEQEEDITKFQKVKKWMKENLVGLSAIGITIAGIITTIIVAGRKALATAASGLGTFGKAVIKTLKALVPVLAPLFNIIATALSWAAKGLMFLSKNLWLLVLFGIALLYRWLQDRRKKSGGGRKP